MKRPRLRFSVSAMMLVVALIAIGLRYVYPVRIQRHVVAAIIAAGGTVQYDWELKVSDGSDLHVYETDPAGRPSVPAWLVKLMGVDYFGTVKIAQINGSAGKPVDDQLMTQVADLDQLEYLYLDDGGKISDRGLVSLRKLPRLRQFRLNGNSHFSGAVLENLSGAVQLESLVLDGVLLKPSDLDTLSQFSRLKDLSLRNCGLTDQALVHLKGLSKLSVLSLTKNPIGDPGLGGLKNLKNLENLALNITQITGKGLVSLEGLQNLKVIKLDRTGVDDLRPLRNLKRLKILTLGACPIDDDDLEVIENLSELQGLAIQRTRITDAGLLHLEKAPALMTVEMSGTGATKQGIAALRVKRPGMKIMD